MNVIPMPGKIKTKTGTCVLDEKTAIILDQDKPLISLEGPLLLTDTLAQAVCRRPVLTRSNKPGGNAIFLTLAGTADAQSYKMAIDKNGVTITGDG